jgi:vacuolar-type H+-ATPase subunit H
VRRKEPSSPVQPATTSTAESLAAIVEAAERAAVTVIDDAEAQAHQRLEEAEAEAGRLVAERLDSVGQLIDSLLVEAEEVRVRSEQLIVSLEEVRGQLSGDPGESPGRQPPRGPHLAAVEPVVEPEAREPAQLGSADAGKAAADGRGTPAGARLLATQMAVSGSSRREIESRLRNGFEIEDAASILDAILGPEE